MDDAASEAELLTRCRAGNHAAFRRVMELHHQRVYRVAYAVVADADRDELDRALEQLTPQAREVVALRYGQDLSVAAIASVLDCPEGTVKSRLNGALNRLRVILGRERVGGA